MMQKLCDYLLHLIWGNDNKKTKCLMFSTDPVVPLSTSCSPGFRSALG